MKFTATVFASSLLAVSPAAAWGILGHQVVGAVADHYLAPATQTFVANLLNGTLSSVATWADTYRTTTAGRFSAPFHYLDALDNPSATCNVDYTRDCGASGCIVSAIVNYTQRVQDGRLTAANQAEALKFLTHFLGDITQPLHVENKLVGGNDISVKFGGTTTNLHSVWDTSIPEKYIGGRTATDVTAFTNEIISKLSTGGAYASSKASWISCVKPTTAQTCAMSWAADANAFVCSYVLNPDPTGQELSGAYYSGAAPIVEQQLAKGGIRLAAYLNTIVTGSPGTF